MTTSPLASILPSSAADAPGAEPIAGVAQQTGDDGPWLMDRPLVLVVDDDPDARDTVAALIEGQGYSIAQASNGAAALELAATLPVAALVLDVMMPDHTGFEVCRALRADPRTAEIPVIMLTALTTVVDEVNGVISGADAYLVKPISREKLLAHLRDVL